MRLLALASAGFVALAGSIFGCASGGEPPEEEPTRVGSHGIVGGTVDPGHDAVVFYLTGGGGQCTATIVARSGSTGFALTAAHCISGGNGQLAQADDYQDCYAGNAGCQAVYDVTETAIHPNYGGNDGDPYDFAMLRFAGAGASTPVIPAAQSPDGLAAGTQVEFVGYGVNEFNDTNRRHVFDTLSAVPSEGINSAVTALFLFYDQNPGGPCNGDSGGPALRNGEVVGVTSAGDENCTQFGVSGRVSAVYSSFIKPFIDGVPPVLNCNDCFQGAISGAGPCVSSVEACFADTNCEGLVDCIDGCGGSTSCINGCGSQWQAGVPLYNAIFDCTCGVCASECSSECAGNPTSTGTGVETGTGTGTSTDTNVGTSTDTNVGTDTGTGTGSSKKKKSGGDSDDDSGCTIAAPGTHSEQAGSAAWIALVGLMAAATGLRRPRRRRVPPTASR